MPYSVNEHETPSMYSLPGIVMYVRKHTTFGRIGHAGVVVALVGARFEAQVYVRSMPGTSEALAVTSLGSRIQRGWLGSRAVLMRHAVRSRRGTECRGGEPGPWRDGADRVSPRRWWPGVDGRALKMAASRSWDGRMTMRVLDLIGLGWASWDMIHSLRRADQACFEATVATRTAAGFHGYDNGVSAGQRPFRWAGMGSL